MEGIKLTIDDDVLDFMVEKAMEYKLGAFKNYDFISAKYLWK